MDLVLPFTVIVTLGVAAITVVTRGKDVETREFLRRTLLIAFAARLALALLFSLVPSARLFHEDAAGYEWLGSLVSHSWWGDGPPVIGLEGRPNMGFVYFVAGLNYLLGPSTIVGSLANALIGTMTIAVVYQLAADLFQPIVARGAARLVAFFPSMMLWSSIAIKDPLVSLLIALSLWGCTQLKRGFTLRGFLLTAVPILAIQPLRFYVVYFVLFAVLVALGFERGLRSVSGVYKQLLLVGLVAALIGLTGLSRSFQSGLNEVSFERVSAFRHGMAATAQSGFSHEADVSTPARAILFLPIGAATLLFSPFPWQLTSLRALLTAPEMIFWWSLLPALGRGLRFIIRERWREASPLLLFTASMSCAYSLIEGNVGAAFRQRSQIFIFLFIFTALGGYLKKVRRAKLPEQILLAGARDPVVDPAIAAAAPRPSA